MVLGGSLLVLIALALAWRYTPLVAWTDAVRIADWAQRAGARPWTPVAVLLAYTPAAVTLFPRPLITMFAVAAFGAWLGFACALAGILLAALVTYACGARMDRATVRQLAGERVERAGEVIRRRGVLAMTAVRLVPIAPFVVVNIAAGAMRIRLAHFAAGSALGILPGTATATVLGDQLVTLLRAPRALNLPLLVVALLAFGVAMLGMRHLWVRWTAR
jgi:phospholipase D1/2